MNELDSILETWRSEPRTAAAGVLATVVHVRGSAYRRPGARMLMLPDGRRIGTVSGGCLEADVNRKAWWFTGGGRPVLRVYDTTSDDDAVWQFGLGCNGVIEILLERLNEGDAALSMDFLTECRAARRAGVVATVVRSRHAGGVQPGDRLLVHADGGHWGRLSGGPVARELAPHVSAVLESGRGCLVHLSGCDVFVECVAPHPELVIFGAGHDAIPLVLFAKQLGWHVTVADARPAYAQPHRFPGADGVTLTLAHDPMAGVSVDPESLVVLMTHNYPLDCVLLRRLARTGPRYLGVLGSRQRAERLLAEAGVTDRCRAVHAPVGLDIGADAPESIALAIVAEIQAVLSGRDGSMLRDRPRPIHAAPDEFGEPAIADSPADRAAAVCEVSR